MGLVSGAARLELGSGRTELVANQSITGASRCRSVPRPDGPPLALEMVSAKPRNQVEADHLRICGMRFRTPPLLDELLWPLCKELVNSYPVSGDSEALLVVPQRPRQLLLSSSCKAYVSAWCTDICRPDEIAARVACPPSALAADAFQ